MLSWITSQRPTFILLSYFQFWNCQFLFLSKNTCQKLRTYTFKSIQNAERDKKLKFPYKLFNNLNADKRYHWLLPIGNTKPWLVFGSKKCQFFLSFGLLVTYLLITWEFCCFKLKQYLILGWAIQSNRQRTASQHISITRAKTSFCYVTWKR